MAGTGPSDALGDLLTSRRRRRFVGRTSGIELVRVAVEAAAPSFSVLNILGPAGTRVSTRGQV